MSHSIMTGRKFVEASQMFLSCARHISSAICIAVLTSIVAAGAVAQNQAIVKIESGSLRGIVKGGVDEYLGIPYAAAPVGELRWKPPLAEKPWSSTFSANEMGKTCPQTDVGVFAAPSTSEDCLYLNVYVGHSLNQLKGGRPVLVWFHGGGLIVGESNYYDGTLLAAQGSAVVVTVNYRLGILGFFAHAELDKEGHPFANYGLMDQQFALRWVKQNIDKFGGDPGNVTIAGQSSGGTSVMSQLVSPGAAGLFQYAISQSGAAIILKHPAFGAPLPLKFAEELGAHFAEATGCPDQTAQCLRKLPVTKILANQRPYATVQAVIDGTVLPTTYIEAFRSGRVNHVTLINGNAHDEQRWAVGIQEIAAGKPLTPAGYEAAVEAFYGKTLSSKVLVEYSLRDYISPGLAYAAAVTDSLYACTGHKVNELLAEKMPTYAYEFADQTAPSYLEATSFSLGAAHTFELQYLFANYHGAKGIIRPLNPLQQKLSAKMIEYWTGISRGAEGYLWPRYDAKLDNYMTLISPEPIMRSGSFVSEHKCKFWDQSGLY